MYFYSVESLRQKDYDGRKSELVYSSSKQTVGGPVKDLAASDFRATYSYAQRSEKT